MGPEGGRPGRHTCSGNLGIAKIYVILGQTRKMRLQQTRKNIWQEDALPPPHGQRGPVLKHNGKSGTA